MIKPIFSLVETPYYQSKAAVYRYHKGDFEKELQEGKIRIGYPMDRFSAYLIVYGRYCKVVYGEASASKILWPNTDSGRLQLIARTLVNPLFKDSDLIAVTNFLCYQSNDARYGALLSWFFDMLISDSPTTAKVVDSFLKRNGVPEHQIPRIRTVWTVCFLRRLIDICRAENN